MSPFNTISLVGMPGAGKSTVGVLLAKLAGLRFVDTDLDIQVQEEATLQEILEKHGYRYLREAEEKVLLNIALDNALISTGGSVVYSPASMARLKSIGPVVYLQTDLATLEERIAAAPPRGIASDVDQSFAQLYAERIPLYEQYADYIVTTGRNTPEQVASDALKLLSSR
ncbi:MAG: shikimate kinase [Halioglobus sp.]